MIFAPKDIRAYDAARAQKEERFPAEVAERLIRGEQPVKVFREHRGLTQAALAKKLHITRPYLAAIETGAKTGSITMLKALAKALRVDLGLIA